MRYEGREREEVGAKPRRRDLKGQDKDFVLTTAGHPKRPLSFTRHLTRYFSRLVPGPQQSVLMDRIKARGLLKRGGGHAVARLCKKGKMRKAGGAQC